MSLTGLTIAITGSRRASELAHLITTFGGRTYIAPTIGIESGNDTTKEAEFFINIIVNEKIDYVIFMTGPAVYSLMATAKNLGVKQKFVEALKHTTVISRSLKPKIALANHGVKTDIMPIESTAEGIKRLLKDLNISNKNIAVLWHGSYSSSLKEELGALGATVFEASTYRYSFELNEKGAKILEMMGFNYIPPDEEKVVNLIKDISAQKIDVITFTSPPAARDLFKIAEKYTLRDKLQYQLNNHIIVVAVGPSTMKTLEENFIKVDVMPTVYKIGPMIKSLVDYLTQTNIPKKKKQTL
ncbi:MAG TPA: uroporphyrinogen-III synthase [Nitrososphaeraceae archaeon]|nr:uroporphyrinogen-III synthase [Nitrososphaeraceae archaeon]